MKLWCQLPARMPPSTFKFLYELKQKDFDLVKRPDTETVIKDVPTGFENLGLFSYLGLVQVNDREILKSMLRAEKEGYDAVAGLCAFDGAIRTARNLMDIPVVGPGEASLYLARMMGSRFALITPLPGLVPQTRQHLEDNKMESWDMDCDARDFGRVSCSTFIPRMGFGVVLRSISGEDKPFTTLNLITHLLSCFDYIGGMPSELVIDQDSVMVVSENHGEIIYTKDFGYFIQEMDLRMYVWVIWQYLQTVREPQWREALPSKV